MTTPKMQSREEVIAEMRATGKYAEPVAGEPTLGYLGDLGHRYARPDQLTKEALFGRSDPEPLVQTPEMKARAEAYERQVSMDSKVTSIVETGSRILNFMRSHLNPSSQPSNENKATKRFIP